MPSVPRHVPWPQHRPEGPHRVTASVTHGWQLTFNDNRDAVSFADLLMEAVERLMDELLSAFEEHLPERFKSA
jgi:hypothetical protein